VLVRTAGPGEVKRLGDEPVVVVFASGDGMIEVAAKSGDRELVIGSFEQHAADDPSATPSDGSASRANFAPGQGSTGYV
jgi:hypothetical protein